MASRPAQRGRAPHRRKPKGRQEKVERGFSDCDPGQGRQRRARFREAKREGVTGVEFRPDGTIFVQISPKIAAGEADEAEIVLVSGREIDL